MNDTLRKLDLCVLGYGNAGRAFGLMLADKHDEIAIRYGTDVGIKHIVTANHGSISAQESEALDLRAIDKVLAAGGMLGESRSAMELAGSAEYDVLVELTPLDIFSGQPATDHIQMALRRGKDVISANKGPVAWYYDKLAALAEENAAHFYFETAVMDGAPVFNLYDETLRMCQVNGFTGILNSTTNFILGKMEEGVCIEEIMAEGEARGFVEADPTLDTLGWDAAAKTAALMNVLMGAGTDPTMIDRKGIDSVSYDMVQDAKSRGKRIKLVSRAMRTHDGSIVGRVSPEELDEHDKLAQVNGTSSVLEIETDLMGRLAIFEIDPGIKETAYGIFSDLLRVVSA